jgi:hypothetical protein
MHDRMAGRPAPQTLAQRSVEGLTMVKMKRGTCYRDAGNRLLDQKSARGWRLVHGFAFVGTGMLIPTGHAWLRLPDGRIWDPTDNAYFAMP